MIITVGSDTENDLVINEPTVSGKHLQVELEDKFKYILTDLNSTNGTFVNRRRIKHTTLNKDDIIELGAHELDTSKFIKDLLQVYASKKTDFGSEYNSVLLQFDEYQKAKDKITKPPILPLLMRVSLVLIVLFIGVLILGVKDIRQLLPLIYLSAPLALIFGYVVNNPKKKQDRLDTLRLKFEDVLVCPKCKYKMINNNLTYWRGKKSCNNERCDAVFQE